MFEMLCQRLKENGAELRTGCAVEHVSKDAESNRFEVRTGGEWLSADHVLITTGGLSYSGCGTLEMAIRGCRVSGTQSLHFVPL